MAQSVAGLSCQKLILIDKFLLGGANWSKIIFTDFMNFSWFRKWIQTLSLNYSVKNELNRH